MLCRLSYPRSIRCQSTGSITFGATRTETSATQSGALAGVGCPTRAAPTAVVPVSVVAVSGLGTVLDALLPVARRTEQLTLACFGNQFVPRSGHAGTDREAFGRWVDVVEYQILSRTAPDALAAEHLHQLSPGIHRGFAFRARAATSTSGAGAGLCWARPRLPGCYGVITMATGPNPTVIGLRAVLVAVRIGVTVSPQ